MTPPLSHTRSSKPSLVLPSLRQACVDPCSPRLITQFLPPKADRGLPRTRRLLQSQPRSGDHITPLVAQSGVQTETSISHRRTLATTAPSREFLGFLPPSPPRTVKASPSRKPPTQWPRKPPTAGPWPVLGRNQGAGAGHQGTIPLFLFSGAPPTRHPASPRRFPPGTDWLFMAPLP